MSKKYKYEPDFAVNPGDSLREAIQYLNMTQKDFAQRLGITEQSLDRIIKGDQPITHETALKLELVTEISAEFWNNLESQHQRQLRIQAAREVEAKIAEWVRKFDTKELIRRCYIKAKDTVFDTALELLRFFNIGTIEAFDNQANSLVATARSTAAYKTEQIPAITYVQMGQREALQLEVAPFDRAMFVRALNRARAMIKEPPKDFCSVLQNAFAEAGVALVFVPLFKGVHFNGVSKWISPNKALIIMNIKGKAEDKFWFSLFHEAGHLLKHSKKQMYLSEEYIDSQEEQEADGFAAEFLIPAKYNERIAAVKSEADIKILARELDLSLGVVVGRYHLLTKKWSFYKHLIRKLEWKEESGE